MSFQTSSLESPSSGKSSSDSNSRPKMEISFDLIPYLVMPHVGTFILIVNLPIVKLPYLKGEFSGTLLNLNRRHGKSTNHSETLKTFESVSAFPLGKIAKENTNFLLRVT
jgi:predicted Zn-dependent protease